MHTGRVPTTRIRRLTRLTTITPVAALLATSPLPAQAELKLVKDLRAHDQAVTHVVFSKDGQWLATSSHDRTTKVFATDTWERRQKLSGNNSQLWTVAFSPNGKRLAVAGDFEVSVYSVRKGKKAAWKCIEKLPIAGYDRPKGGSAFDVLFSRDGKRLFVGTFAGRIDVWDTRKWKLVDQCTDHEGPDDGKMIEFMDAHPDGKTVLSGGRTLATRILRFGKVKKPKGQGKPKDKRRKGWTTVHRFPEKKRKDGHPTHRMCGQFSPDGSVFALGGTDGMLQVFSCSTWKEIEAIQAHPGEYSAALAFHPDGSRLLTASKTLKLWDTKTWKLLAEAKVGAHTQHMTVTPDGRHAVLGCVDGHLRIFEIPARL